MSDDSYAFIDNDHNHEEDEGGPMGQNENLGVGFHFNIAGLPENKDTCKRCYSRDFRVVDTYLVCRNCGLEVNHHAMNA
jgi:hypothetical protein